MSRVNIHATCIAIGKRGVLLLGKSGAGKSDLALRLLDGGAKLVADDRCDLYVRAGKLHARPPASIAGLLELRGIGIIKLPYVASAAINLVVRLEQNCKGARLPEKAFYVVPRTLPQAKPVPLILVNGLHASAPARIRAALAAFSRNGFRDTFNLE